LLFWTIADLRMLGCLDDPLLMLMARPLLPPEAPVSIELLPLVTECADIMPWSRRGGYVSGECSYSSLSSGTGDGLVPPSERRCFRVRLDMLGVEKVATLGSFSICSGLRSSRSCLSPSLPNAGARTPDRSSLRNPSGRSEPEGPASLVPGISTFRTGIGACIGGDEPSSSPWEGERYTCRSEKLDPMDVFFFTLGRDLRAS
jgi:hypothetical protein